LLNKSDQTPSLGAFGYRFTEGLNNVAQLWSIGKEVVDSSDYQWHGLRRKETGKYLLQYTLSGSGHIEINGSSMVLSPGKAFFVEIPSNHYYYFSKNDKKWEFLYIMLYGEAVKECYSLVQDAKGSILDLSPDSSVIRYLHKLYHLASNRKIVDPFQGSGLAYQFIMELYSSIKKKEYNPDHLPPQIEKAIKYIQERYSEPMNLEDIANYVGLSKYHFGRTFRKYSRMTPIQYLTKIRIEKAVELLRYTNLTTEEIASLTGYTSGNYFCKVFREIIGTSPQECRTGKSFAPVDHILIDY
jgi:AraC-like DNA-binding protein